MKKLFYFEKHVKIYKTFQKLLKNVKKFSSTTKSFSDCQKSLNKSFINWKNDENSMKISFFVSSLLLFNSLITHRIFWIIRILFCFNIFRNRKILDIKRTCFDSIWFNWIFSFSWIWFKNFKNIDTQKRFRRIHSTHLKWSFMITHFWWNDEHKLQKNRTVLFWIKMILKKRKRLIVLKKNMMRNLILKRKHYIHL